MISSKVMEGLAFVLVASNHHRQLIMSFHLSINLYSDLSDNFLTVLLSCVEGQCYIISALDKFRAKTVSQICYFTRPL